MPDFQIDERRRKLHHYRPLEAVQDGEPDALQHLVTLIGPGDLRFDVTDRLIRGSIGVITSNTEQEFLELTHGDVTLDLDDHDGAVEQFFEGAQPTDVYEVTIERHTGQRRPRWATLFGGALDLPWSLRFNRKAQRVRVQAFSYSKLLERASAEAVKRTIATKTTTSTTSAGSQNVAVNTTDIEVGDEIELYDLTNRESHRVIEITSGSALKVGEAWSNTFASGTPLDVLSPYHRNKAPGWLAEQLFATASVTAGDVAADQTLAAHPIATPISLDGYPTTIGLPSATGEWTVRGGLLSRGRYRVESPAETWQDFGAPAFEAYDWTEILDEEPATHVTTDGDLVNGGKQAPDYATGDDWFTQLTGGDNWQLYKNSVSQTTYAAGGSAYNPNVCLCFPPEDGKCWVSVVGATGSGYTRTRYWDGAALQTIEASIGGNLVYLRRLGLVALHQRNEAAAGPGTWTTNLRLYNPTTRALVQTVTVPSTLYARTLRVFGNYIIGLYSHGPATRARIWTKEWAQVTDYELRATGTSSASKVTIFTDVHGQELPCVALRYDSFYSELHVLAPYYAGVVPYADFEGMSCAEALRQIALLTMAYHNVDESRIGSLRGRAADDAQLKTQAIPIASPLECEEWPVFEFYRTSCKVSGRDVSGEEIEEIAGDTGDSAHRLELDSPLINTSALAISIGQMYVGFLGTTRRQLELTVRETGDLIRPLDYIDFDGALWLVVEAGLDADLRTYRLRVIEATN
jgi:hypothetical protein